MNELKDKNTQRVLIIAVLLLFTPFMVEMVQEHLSPFAGASIGLVAGYFARKLLFK
jgi:hypothetical protein